MKIILSSISQCAIRNLCEVMSTFATKEVSYSQLAEDNLVVILDLLADYSFFTVDELFGSVFRFRIIKCRMDGVILGFRTGFVISFWSANREVFRLLFDIQVFQSPFHSINKEHFQITITNEVKFLYLLSLLNQHLSVREDMFF